MSGPQRQRYQPAASTAAAARAARSTSGVRLPALQHKTGNGSGNVALWSAVALQQHIAKTNGFHQFLQQQHALPVAVSRPAVTQQQPLPLQLRRVQQQQQQQDRQARAVSPTTPRPPPLTLAQKMGLVQAPPPPPTESQWAAAAEAATKRQVADVRAECGICCEVFSALSETAEFRPQALLSCGHFFHLACVRSLELFARRNGQRPACPFCRAPEYHRRIYNEGRANAEHAAAARIQAAVRGWLARREFFRMRLRADPALRRRTALERLRALGDAVTASVAAREQQVDRFLEQLDLNRQRALASMFSDAEWLAVRKKAMANAASADDGAAPRLECSICCVEVVPRAEGAAASSGKEAVVTSCGHLFHDACLRTLEQFVQKSDAAAAAQKCPNCRCGYAKVPF